MKVFESLNKILHFFIEQKITVSQDKSFLEGLSLYLSLLLIVSFKHPSKYRIPLIQSLAKLIDFGLDPHKKPLYEILFDQAYIFEKMELNIPLNKLFLESLSAIEFMIEFDIFYLKIVDASGFAKKALLEKFKKRVILESWTKNKDTEANIEKALIQGLVLIIEEWDEELWKCVEPLVESKHSMIKREIARFLAVEKKPEEERNTLNRVVWLNDKEVTVSPKFRLCLICKQNKEIFARDVMMKVRFV